MLRRFQSACWIDLACQIDISYGPLRQAVEIVECRVRKRKDQWFWRFPYHPEPGCKEEVIERDGNSDRDQSRGVTVPGGA